LSNEQRCGVILKPLGKINSKIMYHVYTDTLHYE